MKIAEIYDGQRPEAYRQLEKEEDWISSKAREPNLSYYLTQ